MERWPRRGFFRWHNEEHCQWGIGLLTPAVVHAGEATLALEARAKVPAAALQSYLATTNSARRCLTYHWHRGKAVEAQKIINRAANKAIRQRKARGDDVDNGVVAIEEATAPPDDTSEDQRKGDT